MKVKPRLAQLEAVLPKGCPACRHCSYIVASFAAIAFMPSSVCA